MLGQAALGWVAQLTAVVCCLLAHGQILDDSVGMIQTVADVRRFREESPTPTMVSDSMRASLTSSLEFTQKLGPDIRTSFDEQLQPKDRGPPVAILPRVMKSDISYLKRHSHCYRASEVQCRKMAVILRRKDPSMDLVFLEAGGPEAVVQAMHQHPKNKMVQLRCGQAVAHAMKIHDNSMEVQSLGSSMGSFLMNSSSGQMWKAIQAGALDQIFGAVQGGTRADHALTSVWYGLLPFAANSTMHTELARRGIVKHTIQAMKNAPQHEKAWMLYAVLMQITLLLQTENMQLQKSFAEQGLVPEVVEVMRRRQDEQDMQWLGCSNFARLAVNNTENKRKVLKEGAIDVAIAALRHQSIAAQQHGSAVSKASRLGAAAGSVEAQCSQALWVMAEGSPENQAEMARHGAIQELKNALQRNVKDTGLWAFAPALLHMLRQQRNTARYGRGGRR